MGFYSVINENEIMIFAEEGETGNSISNIYWTNTAYFLSYLDPKLSFLYMNLGGYIS